MFRLMVLLSLITVSGVAQDKKQAPPLSGKRHALLIGVSKYPNLADRLQLGGSANDVLLLESTLTQGCQFAPANIRILSEAKGEKDPELLPTRANIQKEFVELAKRAQDGDYVFISMSGHGSQQPEQADVPDREPEPDGLDELFLPRDVGKWDHQSGAIKNAIIDDELGLWLKAIRAKKASVMILVDACHSGTITRGSGAERMRQLDAEADLGIPKEAIKKAADAATERDKNKPGTNRLRGFVGEDPPLKLADKDGFVAIYAAQACEPTVEIDLPRDSAKARAHGILTYTFCQIITESAAASKKPLTYREITQRIYMQYAAWGRTFPTPVIEGPDQDRQIFGADSQPGRSKIELRKANERYSITAGSVHGITQGTILAICPPPGKGEDVIGYVVVESVSIAESVVNPTDYEKLKEVAELPVGGVCKVVSIDFGELRRKVSVDSLDIAGQPISAEVRKSLMAAVTRVGNKPGALVKAIDDPKKADWLVRVVSATANPDEPLVVLVPASGFVASIPGLKPPAFGPQKSGTAVEKWLTDTTRSIAKAENLKTVCGQSNPTDDDTMKMDLTFVLNGKEVLGPVTNLHVFTGDTIQLKVRNSSRFAIDTSVLYTDSSYGIDSLFPSIKRGEDNRLQVNQQEVIPKFIVNPVKASATEGVEQLMVLGVQKSGEQPANFSSLAQPALGTLRGNATDFERLMATGLFGEGQTRAVGTVAVETRYLTKIITLTVHKDRRPKP